MNFNYVSFESILIILHEINMIIVTHPTTFVHCFRVLFFLGHIVKAFQNNFVFIISTETCFWLKRVFRYHLGCFKLVSKRLSRVVAFIIDFSYREYEECQECFSLRSCIAQFHPKHNAFKRVSKQLRVYLLYRSVFLAQTRFRSPFFSAFEKGVSNPIIKQLCVYHLQKVFSNPIIKTALRLSSAKITLKVVWKP